MDQEFIITDKRGGASNGTPADAPPVMTEEEKLELLKAQAAADDSRDPRSSGQEVVTYFVIAVHHDGSASATSEIGMLEQWIPQREATFGDMYSACALVQKDITAVETAQRTMLALQQQAMAAMAAKESQAMQQRLMTPGMAVPRRGGRG